MQFETSGYSFSFNIHKKERSLATDLYKELTPFITEDRIFIYRNQPTAVEKAEKIALDSNRVPKFYPGMWLVQLLMELLAAQIETEEADTFQRQKASKANDIQFTMEIENLIAANYDKDYNITKMAGQLHISTRQLDRIIRKHYGKTLHEIFMEMRVEAAQYYLLNTKMSVDKIAVTVGFNSSVGLYREFKKKHGITPSEYKKRRTS